MNVVRADVPDVLIIEPRVFRDARGFLYESFNRDTFAALREWGIPGGFVQENHSRSAAGVLRGLHYQLHHPQGKLLTCVSGRIFDVAVDIRRGSPTFRQFTATILDAAEPRYVWIPPGFAHGFCVMGEGADVLYKCTDVYHPEDEHGILWSDPSIGIPWPVENPAVAAKDEAYAPLDDRREDLPVYGV
ncbi:MAG: rfbC [Gemmatimonadetes bacterium]|nr:rfbC [Gemmatimonadota bacterium]